MIKKIFYTLSLVLLSTACNQNELQEQIPLTDEVQEICATIKEFEFEQSDFSRTSITIEEDGPHYAWAETDTIGIFPNVGRQVEFSMAEGAGSTSAKFTGGGWGLKSTSTYAAYFPLIGKYYLDKTNIPISYEGQKQISNESTSHLGTYDFLAASSSAVNDKTVSFNFERLGALLRIQFDVPEDMLLTKAQLITLDDDFITKGYLDLTRTTPKITEATATYSNTVSLDLSISAKKSNKVTLYMMIAPANLSDKELYLSVENSAGYVYKAPVICNTKNFEAGKAYALSGTIVQERKASLVDGKTFNTTIKNLCSNGVVKSLKFKYSTTTVPTSYKIVSTSSSDYPVYASASYGNVTISTEADKLILNENSYAMFSDLDITSIDVSNLVTDNVTNMQGMFAGCELLTSLDLSTFNTRKVTNMLVMFNRCKALTNINLEGWVTDKVTSMAAMFNMCTSLQSLDLRHFKTNNVTEMYNMFCSCSSLTSLNIDAFDTRNVTDMSYMFQCCSGLTTLTLNKFNTQRVKKMPGMFEECTSLVLLDLNGFDTENVTDMSRMFNGIFDTFEYNSETRVLNLGEYFVISPNTTIDNISSFTNIIIKCLPSVKPYLPARSSNTIWIDSKTGEEMN